MREISLLPTLLLGFALGLRHALETDHLLAVSTLVSREKNGWRSMRLGAFWGLGHSATLLLIGALIIGMRLRVSATVAGLMEIAVALMLIFLGLRALWLWRRGEGHICQHQHENEVQHLHFHRFGEHSCAHETSNRSEKQLRRDKKQSFGVGMVHGLAGSAALTLMVLSSIPHPLWGLLYIALFGLGLMGGMCLVSALFSWSMGLAERRFRRIGAAMQGLCGIGSLGFGLYLLTVLGAV